MCLIVFNWSPDEHDWLTVSANRDEFLHRPTQPLSRWPGDARIVAGKDLQQGGTWLGANRHGQFAFLTNVRAPGAGPATPESRGLLVREYLERPQPAADFAAQLLSRCQAFAPFNLIVGSPQQMLWITNYPQPQQSIIAPGIHTLSNAALDTPWPKSQLAQQQLQQWLQHQEQNPGQLADLINSRATCADQELPDTGIPLDWERMLSAQLIVSPDYGTRSSTAILGRGHHLTLCELSRDAGGGISACHQETLTFT